MRQLIIENDKLKDGLIQLDGKDYRYLRQVLRSRVGDMISVRLPDGSLKNTTVAFIDEGSRRITLQICAETKKGSASAKSITRGVQAEELDGKAGAAKAEAVEDLVVNGAAEVEFWLFQFIPRPQKFELIVRQATECGVAYIVPVIGDYSEKSSVQALMGSKRERLERIIKEARQQSGSPVNTKVMEPVSLEKAIELWNKASGAESNSDCKDLQLAFVLSERSDCDGNLRASVEKAGAATTIKRAAIAVGSEGGISPEEVKILEEKGLFRPVHFAVNILRCETAALYGIAVLQAEIITQRQLVLAD